MRLLMVLSGFAPLFLLMAIQGNSLFPEKYFLLTCFALAILPTLFLCWRLCVVRKTDDTRHLVVGRIEDHRSHILVYLFATLLPFYREDIGTCRDLAAMLAALAFVVFLFWRLNLHYINVYFAFRGYQIYTISSPSGTDRRNGGLGDFVLITRRRRLEQHEHITAFRLSDTVYFEE